MSAMPHSDKREDEPVDEQATAQDIIDAMRIALMAQDTPHKALPVVKRLLDMAPETESDRGIELLLRLITEASLKVELAR